MERYWAYIYQALFAFQSIQASATVCFGARHAAFSGSVPSTSPLFSPPTLFSPHSCSEKRTSPCGRHDFPYSKLYHLRRVGHCLSNRASSACKQDDRTTPWHHNRYSCYLNILIIYLMHLLFLYWSRCRRTTLRPGFECHCSGISWGECYFRLIWISLKPIDRLCLLAKVSMST